MLKRFRHLPQSLQIMFGAFVLAPVVASGFAAFGWKAMAGLPTWYLGMLVACYVAVPWALAVLLLLRNSWFLYLLIAECLSLLSLAFVAPGPGSFPTILLYVHYVLVVTMVAMALMLINRDILFPFVFPGYRGWRRAPRIAANQRVKVFMPRLDQSLDMMIEDCSLTGVALYCSEAAVDDMLGDIMKGEAMVVTCVLGRVSHQVPMHYMWQSRLSGVLKVGLKAYDLPAMGTLFRELGPRQPDRARTAVRRLGRAWANRHVRRVLNYGLAVLLVAAMALPPLIQAGGWKPLKEQLVTLFLKKAPAPAAKDKEKKVAH